MQLVLALTHSAVVMRHWFEIDLRDASMEHGARIELRELVQQPRRGTESAAQLITADRPLWRADLFDRLTDEPGTFGVAHYHPEFSGNQPCPRVWDTELTTSPWRWLHQQLVSCGAGPDASAWPLDADDSAELSGMAAAIVDLTRQFSPERCSTAAECFRLTKDARESVQLMMQCLHQPDLLDLDWVAPWRGGTN